jgi:hypothetical protein
VEYIPDPPDGEAVNVAVCPLSIVTGETRTDNAVLTVICTTVEVTVTIVPELSFTWSSKCQVPAVDKAPVGIVGVAPAVQLNKLPRLL